MLENVNHIFEEFADRFVGTIQAETDVVYPEKLDRSQLDFSIGSLKIVDAYLEHLHNNQAERMDKPWVNTVLWGGAYVGEAIRRSAPREYNWVDFDEFVREYPDTTNLLGETKSLAVCALLTTGDQGGFTLPINKMLRFINDGPEDSVWFYASCEVKE